MRPASRTEAIIPHLPLPGCRACDTAGRRRAGLVGWHETALAPCRFLAKTYRTAPLTPADRAHSRWLRVDIDRPE